MIDNYRKNSDDRLRIVKLYVQANRNKEAREELTKVIEDFPELAVLKDREQELRQTAAQRILDEIKLRRDAGQPELAYAMLKKFPSEGVAGETLLNIVYPHYVRPIPAMSIAEMKLDPEQGKLTSGYRLPRGTMLYSRPVDGVPCKFQTAYDVTVWPGHGPATKIGIERKTNPYVTE